MVDVLEDTGYTPETGQVAAPGSIVVHFPAAGVVYVADSYSRYDLKAHPEVASDGSPAPVAAPQTLLPGDWVFTVVKVLSFGRSKLCASCSKRRKILNRAGWTWRLLPALWRVITNG